MSDEKGIRQSSDSKGTSSSLTTSTTSNIVVDLDRPDDRGFTGGSSAYGRMAFPQGDLQQPATFVTFDTPNQHTYRSVDLHSTLDDNVHRSIGALSGGHGHLGMHGGGGHGVADLIDDSNPWYSGSQPASLSALPMDSLTLKSARMGTQQPKQQSQSTKLDSFSSFRPTFTAVEVPVSSDRGELVEPPQAPGGYLEPAYHWFSRSSPRIILDTIVAVLGSAGVDCVVKYEKFRLSCAVYSNGQKLPFSVRVFATEGFDRRYAVEFQRRAGDILLFNDVYRNARVALEQSGLVEGGIRTVAKAVESLSPLPPLDGLDSVDQNRITCKNLVGMAASKFVDVKSQAIGALCDMTVNINMASTSMMLTEGVIDTLVNEMRAEFEDVHRPAVTALANLSFRRKDVSDAVLSSDGLKHVIKLAFSDTAQVVRECARCLSNIATCVGTRMDSDDLRSAVRHLISSEDSRARAHCHDLMATLRMTTV